MSLESRRTSGEVDVRVSLTHTHTHGSRGSEKLSERGENVRLISALMKRERERRRS